MAVVALIVFPANGENGNCILVLQGRCNVVLGAQRVTCADGHVGPASSQCANQISRFRRHVQAGADPHTIKRLLVGETLTDLLQDRHFLPGSSPDLVLEKRLRGEEE